MVGHEQTVVCDSGDFASMVDPVYYPAVKR